MSYADLLKEYIEKNRQLESDLKELKAELERVKRERDRLKKKLAATPHLKK